MIDKELFDVILQDEIDVRYPNFDHTPTEINHVQYYLFYRMQDCFNFG